MDLAFLLENNALNSDDFCKIIVILIMLFISICCLISRVRRYFQTSILLYIRMGVRLAN
jgi:hypothetical protein